MTLGALLEKGSIEVGPNYSYGSGVGYVLVGDDEVVEAIVNLWAYENGSQAEYYAPLGWTPPEGIPWVGSNVTSDEDKALHASGRLVAQHALYIGATMLYRVDELEGSGVTWMVSFDEAGLRLPYGQVFVFQPDPEMMEAPPVTFASEADFWSYIGERDNVFIEDRRSIEGSRVSELTGRPLIVWDLGEVQRNLA